MPTIRIPSPLRFYTDGQAEVQVQGTTVDEALQDFVMQYPAIKQHLFRPEGGLRAFVNLFLNDENIRSLHGLKTALQPEDRLLIVPSVAGGSLLWIKKSGL